MRSLGSSKLPARPIIIIIIIIEIIIIVTIVIIINTLVPLGGGARQTAPTGLAQEGTILKTCRKNRDQGDTDDSRTLSDECRCPREHLESEQKPRASNADTSLKISSKEKGVSIFLSLPSWSVGRRLMQTLVSLAQ